MQIELRDFRQYTDQLVEVYNQKGLEGVNVFCVCSFLNHIACYTILNEVVQDEQIERSIERMIKFYNIDEVVE